MQQKYCDHGRSTELLKTTWPIPRARNCCGSGGVPRKASILPSTKSSTGLTDGSVPDPVDILARVEPDMGGHRNQEGVGFVPPIWMPTVLPFRSPTLRISSFANSS